jgi:dTDP-4-amino-4,6-dideoxygalactose transaminase
MFGDKNNKDLNLPVTNALTTCVCSLPIHTEMDSEQLAYIVDGVKFFLINNIYK